MNILYEKLFQTSHASQFLDVEVLKFLGLFNPEVAPLPITKDPEIGKKLLPEGVTIKYAKHELKLYGQTKKLLFKVEHTNEAIALCIALIKLKEIQTYSYDFNLATHYMSNILGYHQQKTHDLQLILEDALKTIKDVTVNNSKEQIVNVLESLSLDMEARLLQVKFNIDKEQPNESL